MNELRFDVNGWPPARNEAKSMLAPSHVHADRVVRLLTAAGASMGSEMRPLFPTESLGLDLTVVSPEEPPADATNYLGGIGDVLEVKTHRGPLEHLADLAAVAAYRNDRQLHEVHYVWLRGPGPRYAVRIWIRSSEPTDP